VNKFLILTILFLSTSICAASQVNYLNIDGDAVHFSLAVDKTHIPPSCAITETNQRYAFSLKTDAGRAMYSLLITALANKQGLDIESANDCADVDSIERVSGLSITPLVNFTNTQNSISKQLYLYTGDGITKLGRIASLKTQSQFYYLADDAHPHSFSLYAKPIDNTASLYFTEVDCLGEAFGGRADKVFHVDFFNDNKYFKTTNERVSITFKSILNRDGCVNRSGGTSPYKVELTYVDPLCGEKVCQIKEE
jgi:hypothetical protein